MFFFRTPATAPDTPENCLFLLSLKTQQRCMLTQPRSQCFFLNAERLIGEESRSIALH